MGKGEAWRGGEVRVYVPSWDQSQAVNEKIRIGDLGGQRQIKRELRSPQKLG